MLIIIKFVKEKERKKIFKHSMDTDESYYCRHGESWYNFRSKVQQVILQPRTARMYITSMEEASLAFLQRFA